MKKILLQVKLFLLGSFLIATQVDAQTYTFTTAGATGINGPTQTQINTEYATTNLAGMVTSTNGIQHWVVPVTGVYKIEALGASGYGSMAGRGASISGEFNFIAGDQIDILVGQKGGCCVGSGTQQYGGGGGSFVVRTVGNIPLIVAGGGGGANGNTAIVPASDASITNSGNNGTGSTNGAGGINGLGGAEAGIAGGGGGFTGDGGGVPHGGKSYVNGGTGGTAANSGGWGGFGGGGGANSYDNKRGGGGGGYSGGGGAGSSATATQVGGGGGSYNSGNNPVNTPGMGTGAGEVKITLMIPVASVPNNTGVISFPSLAMGVCPGGQSVTAMIKNFGNNIIDSVKVAWEVDGVLQTNNWYQVNLDTIGTPNGQTTVTLGTYNFTAGTHNVKAWTSLPNNSPDTANANDTFEITSMTKLAGTYTINSATATAGTNFQSFEDFTDALNTLGVCGPVVANVVAGSGPYVETVHFGNIPGSSAANTIRVNGNGETVQFTNTSSDRQLLTLSGTKYLRIDSLTFKTLATTYGWGALITSGCEYDSITNCTFDLSTVTSTTSTNASGIAFSNSNTSATSSGVNGSNCYISGNKILGTTGSGGPYYCLTMYGDNDNNIIKDNLIQNFYYYGMYIYGGTGNIIDGNEITRNTKTSVTTFYGIYCSGSTAGSLIIRNNKIHDPIAPGATSTSSFYGIYCYADGTATDPVLIYNNVIYNPTMNGIIYGLAISTSLYSRIYHNTIDISTTNTGTSTNYGLYAGGNNTGTEIKNNIVTLTGGSGGTKYGFYYSTSGGIDDAQKNNIYVNSATGTANYGYYGSAYPTQAAFQTAFPTLEVGSMSLDPQYSNLATGDLQPTNFSLFGSGENLMAVVPIDITGIPRSALPTAGAYELPPTGTNNAATIDLVKPTGNLCAGLQPVEVSIMNAGTNTINTVTVNWSVNGVLQTPVVHTGALNTISSGNQYMDTLALGTITLLPATPAVIKVWTSDPNNGTDNQNYNDTIQNTIEAAVFTVDANLDTVCAGNVLNMKIVPTTGYQAGMLGWEQSANGTTWNPIANTDTTGYSNPNVTADIYYRVKIINELTSCYTDTQKITFTDPQLVSYGDTSRCGPGPVTFEAQGAYGSTVKWYEEQVGGALLGTGNTFTTPSLSTNTDYYVAAGLGTGGGGDSVNVPLSQGSTTGIYHHMFLVSSTNGTNISEIGIKCNNSAGTMTAWDVYYRPDNYQTVSGANSSSTGWILLSSVTNVPSLGVSQYTPIATNLSVNIPAGATYSFYIAPVGSATHQYSSPAIGTPVVTTPEATLIAGNRGSSLFNCTSSGGMATVNLKFGAGCESPRQKVTAVINPLPIVDLGEDLDTCMAPGAVVTLDPGPQTNTPTYSWDDNSTNPTRDVGQAGIYSVAVTNQFGCVSKDTINVDMKPTPIVDLEAEGTNLCVGGTKILDAGPDGENGGDYYWNTGAISRTISVTQGGTYIVYVTNVQGCLTIDTVDIVENGFMPSLDEVFIQNQGPFTFNFSLINPENITSYHWDFGDGDTSTLPNPSHTYSSSGSYSVVLQVNSVCGSINDTSTVHILNGTGINDIDANKLVQVYPNPTNGNHITIEAIGDVKLNAVKIYNALGQEVYTEEIHNTSKKEVILKHLASGSYLVKVNTNKGWTTTKLQIVK